MKITCSETLGNIWVSTSWIFTIPSFPGVNTASLLPANGKGPVFLSASPRLRWFCCSQRFFCDSGRAGLCLLQGTWQKNLERLRPAAAVWRLHEAAMPARPGPAQTLPLAAATSALSYPVTLSLSLCSSLFMMDTLPSRSHMPGARQSEQINYFQLQAWQAWAGGGGRGACWSGGPSAPQPGGRPAGAQPPTPPRNMKGDDSRPLRSFLNAKECRKLPDQLVNQWQLQ